MPERGSFNAKDALADYVTVPERIKLFYELFGQGRLVTNEVRLTSEPDGKPRVLVQALAYRAPDDPQPGVGWSWMELPGTTSFTRGSELENTETSAWGRAIAALGILVDRSVASANEVTIKSGEQAAEPTERPRTAEPDGLTGTVEIGKNDADFELRQGPAGYRIGFRLTSKTGGIKVTALSPLAEELKTYQEQIVGKLVTCWGRISDESFRPKGSQREITYQVLTAERVRVPGLGDLPLPVEAATVPLFDADVEAELDAAVPA